MRKLPPEPGRRYFRVEAVLEAPTWALVLAIVLMTIAVGASCITQF
jgi:hypothetical protein